MFIVFFIIILIQINYRTTTAAVYNYGHEEEVNTTYNGYLSK